MSNQRSFFDFVSDLRHRLLGKEGDPLQRLLKLVDFEILRPELGKALDDKSRSKGGRPPMDPVMMFKVPVLPA